MCIHFMSSTAVRGLLWCCCSNSLSSFGFALRRVLWRFVAFNLSTCKCPRTQQHSRCSTLPLSHSAFFGTGKLNSLLIGCGFMVLIYRPGRRKLGGQRKKKLCKNRSHPPAGLGSHEACVARNGLLLFNLGFVANGSRDPFNEWSLQIRPIALNSRSFSATVIFPPEEALAFSISTRMRSARSRLRK